MLLFPLVELFSYLHISVAQFVCIKPNFELKKTLATLKINTIL